MALDQLGQEDTDPIESKPPPEHGNQKSTADHLPSVVHAGSNSSTVTGNLWARACRSRIF
jgi:hypothetical protein